MTATTGYVFAYSTVALVLLITGALKIQLLEDVARRSVFGVIGLGGLSARTIGRTVGAAEIAAGLLIFTPGTARTFALGCAVALFSTGILTTVYLRVRRPDLVCGCAGNLSVPYETRVGVLRNIFLVACSVLALAPLSGGTPNWSSRESFAGFMLAAVVVLAIVLVSPERRGRQDSRRTRQAHGQLQMLASDCAKARTRGRALRRLLRRSNAWLEAAQYADRRKPRLLDMWTERCWAYGSFDAALDHAAVVAVVRVSLVYPQIGGYALTDPDEARVLFAREPLGHETAPGDVGRFLPATTA